MRKPLLSIAMIVKDEIRCIERCLESLRSLRDALPCQLVIADTGSTDGTREIVAENADIFFDFPWVNDFAAARNAALERCTGAWCLILDADEWLDSDFSMLVNFMRSKDRDSYDCAFTVGRNFLNKELKDYGDFYVQRLANRRGGDLRYRGAIHEYLTYRDRDLTRSITLPGVIIYHDGYLETSPGHTKEKLRRNMELLRRELEECPDNLRTLSQCIDSAEDKKEKRMYVERAWEMVRRTAPTAFHPSIYQRCMQFYYDAGENDTVLECYQMWAERCPASALLHVDGEAIAAAAEYRRQNCQAALLHITNYGQGLKDVESHKDLMMTDRYFGQYGTDNRRWKSNLKCIQFQCLCTVGRWEEADALLAQTQPPELQESDRANVARKILSCSRQLSGGISFLNRCWDHASDPAAWAEEAGESARLKWKQTLTRMLWEHWEADHAAAYPLLSAMGDRAPGISGRILSSQDPAEVSALLANADDWESLFPQTYSHVIELGLPFPEGFYWQVSEVLRDIASVLGTQENIARMVPQWVKTDDFTTSMTKFQFLFELTAAALRSYDYADEQTGLVLAKQFVQLAGDYMPNYYNPALLADRADWTALPGLHRFSLELLDAWEAGKSGDELGWVRGLRAALAAAPAMKKAVEFMIDHPPVDLELTSLANQVKAVLDQYTPDDPAVVELKNSPAYQKVAPLLEKEDRRL